ncbi:T9SS type A sorting domain-containing protein [Desulfosarcina sp.]|nr:T9SS type A sorting domain-containing protein [Desulfosarcina sp.]
MKKTLLFIGIAVMFISITVNAQNNALKIEGSEEEPVYNVAHVAECESAAAYRGDEGHDPDSARIVSLGGPWTVEAWVKPDELGMNYLFISGGNTQVRLQHFTEHPGEWWGCTDFNAVGIGTLWNYGPEFDDVFGDPAYMAEVGEWQHLAIIHDGWSIRLIVNGEDEYYLALCHNLDEDYSGYDAPAWGIGDNETGWMPMANCEIDNYRVWEIERSNEEILADMQKITPESTEGLVANYTFDDESGDMITNQADDSRHLQLNEESIDFISFTESTAPIENEGINEQSVIVVPIYPNPASDYIMVEGTFGKNVTTATILDITGRVVENVVFSNNRINLPNMESGFYFVQISDNSKMYTGKVCVK